MADVVVRRRSTGRLRPGTPAVLALAALAALPAAAGLATLTTLTGCAASSKPARVVEARPAAAETPAAAGKTAGSSSTGNGASAANASNPSANATEIRSLDLREGAPEVYLELEASAPLVWTSFRNSEGKVVVELPNAVPAPKIRDLAPENGLIAAVKVERATEGSRPMTRLIISTRHEVEHSVSASGSSLQVRLLPLEEAAAASSVPTPAGAAPSQSAPRPAPAPQAQATAAAPAGAAVPAPAAAEPAAPSSARGQKLAFEPVAPESASSAAGTPDQPAMGTAPKGPTATRLDAIEVALGTEPSTVIRITGDGAFPYSTFALESPSRFVIDLEGVVNRSARSTVVVQGGRLVQRVRVAQFKPPPKGVARVVFDLQQKAVPQIEQTPGALVVSFPGAGSAAPGASGAAMTGGSPASTPAPTSASPAAGTASASGGSTAETAEAPATAARERPARAESAKTARKEKAAASSTPARKASRESAASATSASSTPSAAAPAPSTAA